MNYTYCDAWNTVALAPSGLLEPAEAQRRHQLGGAYTALVGPPEQPDAVIEVHGEMGFVSVTFLDERSLDRLIYEFETLEGRLFLQAATVRTWHEQGELATAHVFRFRQDGRLYITRRLAGKDYDEETEAQLTPEELKPLWDDVPAFGRYEHLLREERDLPSG